MSEGDERVLDMILEQLKQLHTKFDAMDLRQRNTETEVTALKTVRKQSLALGGTGALGGGGLLLIAKYFIEKIGG